MEPKIKRVVLGLYLLLAVPAAECFIVGSFRRPRGGCDVNRPLRGVNQHVLSRAPGAPSRGGARSNAAAREGTVFVQTGGLEGRRATFKSPSGLRQEVRLFAVENEDIGGDGELEREDDGDEEENYVEGGGELEGGEEDEEEEEEEEEEEVGEVEEKEPFVLTSEYDACTGEHDFFDDLIPIQEYDFSVNPDDAVYSAADLRGNVGSPENPFDLTSFYVDREIKMGVIDEEMEAIIQPMMSVIEQVCELIDTTDNVFSFKYTGLIRNKKGIEAWTKSLIKPLYPDVQDVVLVTNRTRDRRDH